MAVSPSDKIKVLKKLYELKEAGADFVRTRWYFDWEATDDPSSDYEADYAATREMAALISLATAGCIRLERKPISRGNTYPDDNDNLLNIGLVRNETDEASKFFDWAAWIKGFNYKTFVVECERTGYHPAADDTNASLLVNELGFIVVTIDGIDYALTQMHDNSNWLTIVKHCLSKQPPDETVTRQEVKGLLGLQRSINIKELLRNTYFEAENGVLSPFIKALTPGRIVIGSTAKLTDKQKKL